ncbi:Transmembrane exosortase (Exosortase_EpsH) [Burkholderiales bacterium JOSHI_001]|nr:Transmembrane exosortase (Exosortase_EpsH) [Burkholderiales bacterium JOSHI_001]
MTAAAPAQAAVRPARWGLRVLAFLVLFLALQAGYSSGRGGALERLVIDQATVRTAAALIDTLSPELQVRADGPRLRASGGGLNVLNGCEGTDVAFLLVAAMVVAPLSWRRRGAGLALGLPLVFALNQLRVLALFYAFRSDRTWFDLLHGAVGPLLLVLAVGLFFIVWLNRGVARVVPPGMLRALP